MDINRLVRYLVYALELMLLFMLQGTPGLFPEIFGARPLLIVPGVFTIAMMEDETSSIGFGIAGGLLLDFGAPGTQLGFFAIILAALCYLISMLTNSVLKVNLGSAILIAVWSIAIVVALSWFFLYYAAGYSHSTYALTQRYLPQYGYTFLLFPLIFLVNRGISYAMRTPE